MVFFGFYLLLSFAILSTTTAAKISNKSKAVNTTEKRFLHSKELPLEWNIQSFVNKYVHLIHPAKKQILAFNFTGNYSQEIINATESRTTAKAEKQVNMRNVSRVPALFGTKSGKLRVDLAPGTEANANLRNKLVSSKTCHLSNCNAFELVFGLVFLVVKLLIQFQ